MQEALAINYMQVSTCPQCGAPIYIKVANSTDLEPWQKDVPPVPEYSCNCKTVTGHTWVKHNG
jgi:hypothetical protein